MVVTVATENGETEVSVCVNDGVDDFVSFDSTGVTGPKLRLRYHRR